MALNHGLWVQKGAALDGGEEDNEGSGGGRGYCNPITPWGEGFMAHARMTGNTVSPLPLHGEVPLSPTPPPHALPDKHKQNYVYNLYTFT